MKNKNNEKKLTKKLTKKKLTNQIWIWIWILKSIWILNEFEILKKNQNTSKRGAKVSYEPVQVLGSIVWEAGQPIFFAKLSCVCLPPPAHNNNHTTNTTTGIFLKLQHLLFFKIKLAFKFKFKIQFSTQVGLYWKITCWLDR